MMPRVNCWAICLLVYRSLPSLVSFRWRFGNSCRWRPVGGCLDSACGAEWDGGAACVSESRREKRWTVGARLLSESCCWFCLVRQVVGAGGGGADLEGGSLPRWSG